MLPRILRLLLPVLMTVLVAATLGCQDTAKATTASTDNQQESEFAPTTDVGDIATLTPTQTSTPANASLPSVIAFRNNGIAIATSDGKIARQLTTGNNDQQPVFSPDGKKIAYQVYTAPPQGGIYVYFLEDGTTRKVADASGLFLAYSWSPDSKHIVYNSNSTSDMGIFVADVTTGNNTRITPKGDTVVSEPSWSPDGKWIAFLYGGGISIFSPDGTTSKQIAKGSFMNPPAWSPDSQKVALTDVTKKSNGQFDLVVAPIDGSGPTKILDGKGGKIDQKWSPDGKRILYSASSTHGKQDYNQLWVANADGSDPRLYLETVTMSQAWWSPEGSSIAIASDKDGLVLVHIISADGYYERAVVQGTSPSWIGTSTSVSIQQLGKPMAQPVLDLSDRGKSYMGVAVTESNGDILSLIGQPAHDGLIVTFVLPDSPAASAGLAPKDILTKIGNQDINTLDDFDKVFDSAKPEDKVTIQYVRAGKEQTTDMVFKQRPADYALRWNQHISNTVPANSNDPYLLMARGIYEDSQDTARAWFYFDRAIQLDSKFAAAYYWRAFEEMYFGNNDEARADLQKASQLTQDKDLLDWIKQAQDDLPK